MNLIPHTWELPIKNRIFKRPIEPQPRYPGLTAMKFELHPFSPSAFKDTPAEGFKIAPEKKVWIHEDWCGNVVGEQGDCPWGQPGDKLVIKLKNCNRKVTVKSVEVQLLQDVSPQDNFIKNWNKSNPKYLWDTNPWIWAISI